MTPDYIVQVESMIGRTGKCLRISLFEDTGKNVPHSCT